MSVVFSFNGISKDWIQILPREARWMAPLIDRPSVQISGSHGARFGSATLRPRVLHVPIGIFHDGFEDLQRKKIELSSWLITLDSKYRELRFSDEPDIYYPAFLSMPLGSITETLNYTTGVLEFTCDPFRYSLEPITTNATTIINNGSAEALTEFVFTTGVAGTEFILTHQETGKSVRIVWNFGAGNLIAINMNNQTVSINGVTQMPALDWRSNFFMLQPGVNTLVPSIQGTLTTTYTERWL